MIDKLEKVGRLVLWLALAATCIAGLVSYIGALRGAAELHAQLERKQQQLEEALKPKPPEPIARLTLESMGALMRVLNTRASVGKVFFSNVSARSGMICVTAIASNAAGVGTESLPTCMHVKPYDSNVAMEFAFAGADLEAVCKADDCGIKFKDKSDDAPAPPVAAAIAPAPVPAASATN